MGQALTKSGNGFPPLLVETQIFTLWTISDVRDLKKRVSAYINGFAAVEIQFESLLQMRKDVTEHLSLDKLFKVLDNDCDGRIDCLELLGGLALICNSSFEEKARFCFELYDFNLNGTLSPKELTMMIICVLCGLNCLAGGKEENEPKLEILESYAEDAFLRADRDHSGQISYEEFISWARSNRDIMTGLEGLQKIAKEAKSYVQCDDSASEVSISECFIDPDEGDQSAPPVEDPSAPAPEQSKMKWKQTMVEPLNAAVTPIDECFTNLSLSYAIGINSSALYAKRELTPQQDLSSAFVAHSTAALVVVQNTKSLEQSFYSKHKTQIISLTADAKGSTFASADISGCIHIWGAAKLSTLSVIHVPRERGVARVCLSPTADSIAVVGADADHTITIYDVLTQAMIGITKGIAAPGKVYDVCYSQSGNEIVVVGTKQVIFLANLRSSKFGVDPVKGYVGNIGKLQIFYSVAYLSATDVIVGCSNGEIYRFTEGSCSSVLKAHGDMAAVLCLTYSAEEGVIVSACSDGIVKTWDITLKPVGEVIDVRDLGENQQISTNYVVKSVAIRKGAMAISTKGGDLIEVSLFPGKGQSASINRIFPSHYRAINSVSCHPIVSDFATTGDDKTVRVWRIENGICRQLHCRTAPKMGAAIAYSSTGKVLCMGMVDGDIALMDADTLRVYSTWAHTKSRIIDAKFSAKDDYLALAAADSNIYLYCSDDRTKFTRHTICRGTGVPLTRIDFSFNSKFIVANYVDFTLAYWDCMGVQVTDTMILQGVNWFNNCSVYDWSTQGLWSDDPLASPVSCCQALTDIGVIAAGIDSSIHLVRYPCNELDSLHKRFCGHSATISDLEFVPSKRYLVTIGGADRTILIWRHDMEVAADSSDEEPEALVEGSLQSSIHRLSTTPALLNPSRLSYLAPSKALHLTGTTDVDFNLAWIHGYRGWDCTSNVKISSEGSIVYPAACNVVSYSKVTGKQRFLHGAHERDVTCIAIHPSGGIFASAERGDSPLVTVWSEKDMKTLWRHRSRLRIGIQFLCFNEKGDILVSVGYDREILISDWKQGIVLISAACHPGINAVCFVNGAPQDVLAIAGSFGIKFWVLNGTNYQSQRGLWKKQKASNILSVDSPGTGLCVSGSSNGDVLLWQNYAVIRNIGAQMSPLNSISGGTVLLDYPHTTAVCSIFATAGALSSFADPNDSDLLKDLNKSARFITSDSQGNIAFWRLIMDPMANGEVLAKPVKLLNVSKLDNYTIDVQVNAVYERDGRLVFGTRGCEIQEVAVDLIPALRALSVTPANTSTLCVSQKIVCAHHGEKLHGLVTHPTLPIYISCDENFIRCWTSASHDLLSLIESKGASAIDISPTGHEVAVGCDDGTLRIIETDAFINPLKKPQCAVDKDLVSAQIFFSDNDSKRKYVYNKAPLVVSVSKSAVTEVKFSFSGEVLAVGGADGTIYLLNSLKGFVPTGKCEGFASSVVSIDFGVVLQVTAELEETFDPVTKKITSKFLAVAAKLTEEPRDGPEVAVDVSKAGEVKGVADPPKELNVHKDFVKDVTISSLCIQATSSSLELNCWSAENGSVLAETTVKEAWWSSQTGAVGWHAQGVWTDHLHGTILSTDRCHSWAQVPALAVTDAAGTVKLFNYPCLDTGAPDKAYFGHGGPVCRGRWSFDDTCFITAGTQDRCLFVWATDILDEIRERSVRSADHAEHATVSEVKDDFDSKLVLKAPKEPTGGDETSAVKPWKAAAREPTNWVAPPDTGSPPEYSLELKFVYGYRGFDCRANIGVIGGNAESIIYHAAAVGIVYDMQAHAQIHNLEHDDDIISIAVHPTEPIVATGEVGKQPKLVLWSALTGATIRVIKFHSRGISNLTFDKTGSAIISCGLDDERIVAVHNCNTGQLLGKGKAGKGINLYSCVASDDGFVTGGKNHIKFWELPPSQSAGVKELSSKSGVYHKSVSVRTVVSAISFEADTFTGMSDGMICQWKARTNVNFTQAHTSAVTALCILAQFVGTASSIKEDNSARLVSAGKDGHIIIWSMKFEKEWSLDLQKSTPASPMPEISAVTSSAGRLIFGTAASEIFEVELATALLHRLVEGHYDARGETDAIAAAPDSDIFATGGDDCTVRIWDAANYRQKFIRTMSSKVRAIAFHSDGSQLAVGCFEGKVKVLSKDLSEQVADIALSSAWIQAMRYAPDGLTLAVGSHDTKVYLISTKGYCIRNICSAHHSFIASIDFSIDSKVLQTSSGDYELLFWSNTDGKQIKAMGQVCDLKWATWSASIGWPVQGIFPPGADGTDVNSVARSSDGKLLVTGDDFRRVKLFRYPAPLPNAKFKEYKGHAEHVMGVSFVGSDKIVTVGGLDKSILQFNLKK